MVADPGERQLRAAIFVAGQLDEELRIDGGELGLAHPRQLLAARLFEEGLEPQGIIEQHRDDGARVLIHRALHLCRLRLADADPAGEPPCVVAHLEIRRVRVTEAWPERDPIFPLPAVRDGAQPQPLGRLRRVTRGLEDQRLLEAAIDVVEGDLEVVKRRWERHGLAANVLDGVAPRAYSPRGPMTSLQTLLTEGIIDEVLGQLKSGKEAEVWLVRRAEEILAAKIYKEREHRSFKNNAEYKEGRHVRNTRTQRAMDKGSRFGREAEEAEWKAAEADALFTLHAAGARVPRPVMFFEGVLLMDVVVDPEGHAAPRLVDAQIPREKGLAMYEELRMQAVRLLCADLIHGDLSEFNVLLAWDGPTIIDFPQVISAAQNSRAEHFFKRDLDNLRRFFSGIDPAVGERESDADEIWRAYVKRDLTADFVPSGRVARKQHQPQGRGRPQQRQPQGPQRTGAEVSYRGQTPAPPAAAQRPPQQSNPRQQQAAKGRQDPAPRHPQQDGRGNQPQRQPGPGGHDSSPRQQQQRARGNQPQRQPGPGAQDSSPRQQQQGARGNLPQRQPGAQDSSPRQQQQGARGNQPQRQPDLRADPQQGHAAGANSPKPQRAGSPILSTQPAGTSTPGNADAPGRRRRRRRGR